MLKRIKYNPIWETEFNWLKPSQMSDYYALCILCKQYFKIDKSGKTAAMQHSKSEKHLEIRRRRKNSIIASSCDVPKPIAAPFSKLSKEEEVISAEILWTLKTIERNFSFNGTYDNCCSIFKLMFPDSLIAKNVDLERTKMKYLAQFGIVPHIEKIIKIDVSNSPFSLIINQRTSLHCKKQFDFYIQYWSNVEDKLVTALYCGTIFISAVRVDLLKVNTFELLRKLNLDCALLLQVLLVSPNSNLKFYKLLVKELEECYLTCLLDIGFCSVYSICTGLRKGFCCINFAYEEFLCNLVYFFKLHHNQKNDKNLNTIAGLCCKFFINRTPLKWLLLKPLLQKIIEQFKNIKDYFLLYLPKQDNFKKEIEGSNKYKCTVRIIKNRCTLIYLNFMLSSLIIFEPILTSFLKPECLIIYMHENVSKLLFDLMCNFLKRSVLIRLEKNLDWETLSQIDCRNNNFHLHNVALNLNTKKEIGLSSLNAKTVADLQNEFLQFYVETTSYIQNKFPINSEFLNDVAHLHPTKRNNDSLSRIAKNVLNAIKNETVLNRLFHTQGKDKNSICDIIVGQAKMYVYEKDLPSDNVQEHWKFVGQLKNNMGEKKYLQLYTLCKCVLVLSQGNLPAEEEMKSLSGKTQEVIAEDDVYAIRLINDHLNRIGGIDNFKINRELIKNVKSSYKRYVEYVDKKNKKRNR